MNLLRYIAREKKTQENRLPTTPQMSTHIPFISHVWTICLKGSLLAVVLWLF